MTETQDATEERGRPEDAPEREQGASAPGSPTPEGSGAHGGAARAEPHEQSARAEPHEQETPDDEALRGDVDELVSAAAQRDEYLALAQRTQADFENYRKRVARELAGAKARGAAHLARELLPALDSLDRALEGAQEDDPLLDGVRLVRNELTAALGRVGIESFAPLGETFDPSRHEAMAQRAQEGAQSGTIIEVYQAGYSCNGEIIRPARVVVAQ
jgi:molecular chaperone GrpE